ncbi:hypothetical protein ASPWEDRAFT_54391 [Aspergillus wentii DTO 134E9]|uniref:t-SNARE coiled-coil homology domain-containing protein n=1 Tax=Aspergillus wentii DTO 134E9 TaxID=1073089 RepID=A0A1L9R880_ASPWE|nr:uncharacterized protein ASPWEDRAFT_54391 [Aspergillus wentii DTO 134E9]KAI9924954.1 hypothetical protein MW887_006361 [Aspergillus wentii]OJJ31119.1 hypothetical protein ASPWEDRAFT_54391 [Aspergillus wentii DTO 134E9]
MTDITPAINQLLTGKHAATPVPSRESLRSTETADEFLKEAYRINSHIHSLLHYLQSIRHSYLSTNPTSTRRRRTLSTAPSSPSTDTPKDSDKHLTDTERDSIDSSTALLLRDLSSSIANLSSAESLRQETETSLLRKKYGSSSTAANLLFRWAGGTGALEDDSSDNANKSAEQVRDEEVSRTVKTVRENVLWFLRRGLESAAEVQMGMVERRIERVREKEKSVLYKSGGAAGAFAMGEELGAAGGAGNASMRGYDATAMSEGEAAAIESQLSPEQLQLFAQENDTMLKHYEDTLSKVQNAEKSLIEISSLQQTLVTHLATQEEYIGQLVSDAATTQTNVGQGNKELKRATESRSTAQAVFWGTVGLCTWLVVWDLVF